MSNEIEIRNSVKELLSKSMDGIIVDEFTGGTMRTRPDVVMFGDRFTFVEIKSDKDSLTRLENQIIDYSRYCDEVIVIVDVKHREKYSDKAYSYPHHTGAIFEDGKIVTLSGKEYDFAPNEYRKNNHVDLVYLLWAEERRQLLRPLGSVPNAKEYDVLGYCYTPYELNRYAREIIIDRWEHLSKQEKRYQKGYSGGKLKSQIRHIEHKKDLLIEYKQIQKNKLGGLFA